MEKKMKYDFKLKLKFLNFFYLHKVMPPSNFSPKMNNRGDGDNEAGNSSGDAGKFSGHVAIVRVEYMNWHGVRNN